MKKLLVLLLAMLLCLGVLVACDEEEPSSESSDLEVEATKDALVEYYYKESYSEKIDSFPKTKIELVKSTNEFLDFVSPLVEYPENLHIRTMLDDEELFETYYILKVTLYSGKRNSIIGYRNLSVSENGKCSLILDNIYRYDGYGYKDGKPSYYNTTPYDDTSSEQGKYTVYYDFVLIPKSAIHTELTDNTNIELYILTYPIPD